MVSLAAVRLWLAIATVTPATTAIPPAPEHWVTDPTGFLSPRARDDLDARLHAYENQTGHQIIVWIGTTTGGVPIEDFAVRAFAAWRIGRAHLDDGVAVFVFGQDRRMRIEVGYGLESVITDAQASRIIREIATPKLASGDHDGAIEATATHLMQLAGGHGAQAPPARRHVPIGMVILGVLALAGFLILLATNPTLAMFLLANLLSGSRRGGGGGGGGGGFSGGGGRSGGGGASGGW